MTWFGTGTGRNRSGWRGRSVAILAMAVLAGLARPGVVGAAPIVASEYQVKAAFIFNFAQFIEWPPTRRGAGDVTLCILGADPFGPAIDGLDGRPLTGAVMRVRRISRAEDGTTCEMIFIPDGEIGRAPAVLASTRGRPVITIGESPGAAARGLAINFYVEHSHVRFEINHDAVERTHLKMSSNLLRLARIVYDETQSGD